MKKKPIVEGSNSCEDWEWEDLTGYLTELVEKRNPSGLWYAEVKNFGWRQANGHKDFTAHTGKDLLRNILPSTECSFRIYLHGRNGFAINNAHHDSPVWAEWYYIKKGTEGDAE